MKKRKRITGSGKTILSWSCRRAEGSESIGKVVYSVQLHFTVTALMCALDLITRIVIHYSSHTMNVVNICQYCYNFRLSTLDIKYRDNFLLLFV